MTTQPGEPTMTASNAGHVEMLKAGVPSRYLIDGWPAVALIARELVVAGFTVRREFSGVPAMIYSRGSGREAPNDRFIEVWSNGREDAVFEVWPSDRYCEVYHILRHTIRTNEMIAAIRYLAEMPADRSDLVAHLVAALRQALHFYRRQRPQIAGTDAHEEMLRAAIARVGGSQ